MSEFGLLSWNSGTEKENSFQSIMVSDEKNAYYKDNLEVGPGNKVVVNPVWIFSLTLFFFFFFSFRARDWVKNIYRKEEVS